MSSYPSSFQRFRVIVDHVPKYILTADPKRHTEALPVPRAIFSKATARWAGCMVYPGKWESLLSLRPLRVAGWGCLLAISLLSPPPLSAQQSATWPPVATLAQGSAGDTATILVNGAGLIARGRDAEGHVAAAEVFDPATRTSMGAPRGGHSGLRLFHDDPVFIAGGTCSGQRVATEVHDPVTATFRPVAPPGTSRPPFGANCFIFSSTGVLPTDGELDRHAIPLAWSERLYFAALRGSGRDDAALVRSGATFQQGRIVR